MTSSKISTKHTSDDIITEPSKNQYSEDSHNATSLNATFRIMQLTVIATNLVHQSLIATFKNYIS